MVLDAADQALREAGYDRQTFDRRRTGVIVGTQYAGDFDVRLQLALRLPHTQALLRELLAERGVLPGRAAEIIHAFDEAWHARWPVLLDNSGSYSASSLAVRIAKTWDLMGGAAAVDSGTTSALAALGAAVDRLLSADCDLMICAAAQRNLNAVGAADVRRTMPPGRSAAPSQPFDRNGTGYQVAEGAGVLLLKRLSNARRDGDPIQAVWRGVTAAHDESGDALGPAIDRCCQRAGVHARDLALLVCDACGAAEIDQRLFSTIGDWAIGDWAIGDWAIGDRSASGHRTAPLPLRSVVGQFGHMGGASGMASLLAAILALREGCVPGAADLKTPFVAASRRHSVVECCGPQSPLDAGPDGRPAIAAVVSHGNGLAYCALIEQAPQGKRLNPLAESPAVADRRPLDVPELPTADSAPQIDSASVAANLIRELADLTGYPPEVLALDADLQSDLDIQAEETAGVIGQLQQHFGQPAQRPPQGLRTMRQVAQFLQGNAAVAQTNGDAKPGIENGVARRAKLEVVDAPWPAGPLERFQASGAVLLLGNNPAAELLRERLEAGGATVYHLSSGSGAEAVLAMVDQLPAKPALRHVFILTALDPGGENLLDPEMWQIRRALGVELPSLVLQKWGTRLTKDRVEGRVTIAAATSLGGDFGVAETVVAPEGGWIAGLLKSVHVELTRHGRPATVKVCDFAQPTRPVLWSMVCSANWPASSPRWKLRSRPADAGCCASSNGKSNRWRAIRSSAATPGLSRGARGITAEVALALGRQFGLNLHLLGRSRPQRERRMAQQLARGTQENQASHRPASHRRAQVAGKGVGSRQERHRDPQESRGCGSTDCK